MNNKNKRNQDNHIKEDLKKYTEYYQLSEYQRRCLPATNYFRVLNGQHEILVPPSDTHYHKYFDKRCYELAPQYQKLKSSGGVFSTNIVIDDELKKQSEPPVELKKDKPVDEIKKQDLVNEVKPEEFVLPKQEPKIKFSSIEENEKIKTESKNDKIHHLSFGVNVVAIPLKKEKKQNKSSKKKSVNKSNDVSQISLF